MRSEGIHNQEPLAQMLLASCDFCGYPAAAGDGPKSAQMQSGNGPKGFRCSGVSSVADAELAPPSTAWWEFRQCPGTFRRQSWRVPLFLRQMNGAASSIIPDSSPSLHTSIKPSHLYCGFGDSLRSRFIVCVQKDNINLLFVGYLIKMDRDADTAKIKLLMPHRLLNLAIAVI